MKGTKIFITKEELDALQTEIKCSGMWLSGGMPIGNPERKVFELQQKYHPPEGAGLNPQTGEWMLP